MSKSNGTTTEVVNIDEIIERAIKLAADGEETRQLVADDSLRQENEALEAEVAQLREQLQKSQHARIISDDPRRAEQVATVLTDLGDLLFLPNGDLRDLKSLRQQILSVIHSSNGNGTTSTPASPPTAQTVPGPPAPSDKDDKDGSEPGMLRRAGSKVASAARSVVHMPEPASSGR